MTSRAIRLLHTSDLHLGAPFGVRSAAWHGVECLCPLLSVAQLARGERCDLLIIAGDLFDNNRVRPDFATRALELLDSLPMPSVVLPGNHDACDDTSIYRRLSVLRITDHVHIIREAEGERIELPSLGLVVWGQPVVTHDWSNRPLANAPRHPGRGWYIVVGHGEFIGDRNNRLMPRSSPISAEDISSTEADYVALGHWDSPAYVGDGSATAWYSGAPVGGGEHGHALSVTLDARQGITVQVCRTRATGAVCDGQPLELGRV